MVRVVTVLFAIGIGPDECRQVLVISGAFLDVEVHWVAFFESLLKRGMSGVQFLVWDNHSRLKVARRALFVGVVCVATLPVPSGAECHSPYAQPEYPETHWC